VPNAKLGEPQIQQHEQHTAGADHCRCAQAGAGRVVAVIAVRGEVSTGAGIGTVTTVNTVKSVTVNAGQTVINGQTKQLTFTARDAGSAVVAVTPGSALWTITSGSDALSVSKDGIGNALKLGIASAQVVVDGVTSAATTVETTNDPDGSPIVLNFDELAKGVSSIGGTTVTAAAQLSTHYRAQYGASFTSAAGYVAVVDLGAVGTAPTSPNGIAAATAGGLVDYNQANPIEIIFTDPNNPSAPGVTTSISVTADLDGVAALNGTLQAFDVAGNKVGEITSPDPGGEVRTMSFSSPIVHRVLFIGTPVPNQDGIALDNVTFSPVVPAS